MFWGRNANERDGYRAPPVIGWNSRIRRTPGHLTVPVRRVCCRLEELVWYDEPQPSPLAKRYVLIGELGVINGRCKKRCLTSQSQIRARSNHRIGGGGSPQELPPPTIWRFIGSLLTLRTVGAVLGNRWFLRAKLSK
jgi:hypothetical protein